jgi:hypothetical protein
MIDQLLARTETDLAAATRRHELALALAADWSWWGEVLATCGQAIPVRTGHDITVRSTNGSGAPQRACQQCNAMFTPATRGKPQRFCTARCRLNHYRAEGKGPWRPRTELPLDPEPLPDWVEGRPFSMADAELTYVSELLRPPALPWETRG